MNQLYDFLRVQKPRPADVNEVLHKNVRFRRVLRLLPLFLGDAPVLDPLVLPVL